jgi:hypothetical protein
MDIIGILFITFYGPIDYIDNIYTEYQKVAEDSNNNLHVHEFPYLKYQNEEKKSLNEICNMIVDYSEQNDITHIFWFFFPENNVMEMIKNKINVKYVYYNFDDPKSFNCIFINKAKNVDYFINPIQTNQRKYMILMDKYVHILPHYVNIPIVNNDNDDDLIDIAVVIDDEYTSYDLNEKIQLNNYINKIKFFCIDNGYTIRVHGDGSLENDYPDIYEGVIDSLNESLIYNGSKIIIILDFKTGLSKGVNRIINSCSNFNKLILTNSNQVNNIIYKPKILKSKHVINNIYIFDINDLDVMKKILNYYHEYINVDSLVNNGNDINNTTNHDNKILTLNKWVMEIINIIRT